MTWLSGYSKRKPLTLTGGASGAQTDFQLKLAVAYAAAMQSDFDDIRFTQSNGTTEIDAWLETKTNDTSATVWAEFPTTPANTVEQDYYMYYGNAGAASDWDGAATFLAFFDGDSTGWTEVDPATYLAVNNNRLEFTQVPRNVDAYFYKQITGVNQFHASFTGIVTAKSDSMQPNYFAIGDIIDDARNIDNGLRIVQDSAQTYINRRIADASANSGLQANTYTTQYWWDLYIDSDTAYMKLFSDSARTTQVGSTQSIDVSGLTISDLIYVYAFSSSNTGHAGNWATGWADDLIVRKYASGPPTYEFGSEESVGGMKNIFYGPFSGPLGGPI